MVLIQVPVKIADFSDKILEVFLEVNFRQSFVDKSDDNPLIDIAEAACPLIQRSGDGVKFASRSRPQGLAIVHSQESRIAGLEQLERLIGLEVVPVIVDANHTTGQQLLFETGLILGTLGRQDVVRRGVDLRVLHVFIATQLHGGLQPRVEIGEGRVHTARTEEDSCILNGRIKYAGDRVRTLHHRVVWRHELGVLADYRVVFESNSDRLRETQQPEVLGFRGRQISPFAQQGWGNWRMNTRIGLGDFSGNSVVVGDKFVLQDRFGSPPRGAAHHRDRAGDHKKAQHAPRQTRTSNEVRHDVGCPAEIVDQCESANEVKVLGVEKFQEPEELSKGDDLVQNSIGDDRRAINFLGGFNRKHACKPDFFG